MGGNNAFFGAILDHKRKHFEDQCSKCKLTFCLVGGFVFVFNT